MMGLLARRWVICTIAALVATEVVWGQKPAEKVAEPRRPKIGLVLSGGGARGAFHVAVLRALEEMHVPIDCIAGTSAGALVGGLYAAGVSPDEIASFVNQRSFERLFSDLPPRREIPFRRKEEDRRYLSEFEAGIKAGRVRVPRGLISGQNFSAALDSLMLKAAPFGSFDDLPIPFRAVATDLETGDKVVLDHGDLPQAVLASMAIPGVFAPVERDGRLLVDGGLVDNLPVDVAKSMGADIIIAVDIGTPLARRDSLLSPLDISRQVITILTAKNEAHQASLADILIRPDLAPFRSSQYSLAPQLIELGAQAMEGEKEKLLPLALDEPEYSAYREACRAKLKPARPIDLIRFTGSNRVDGRIVEAQMRTRTGEVPDVSLLKRDLERIYGLGDFEKVEARLKDVQGQRELVVEARDKPWGPNYMRFALEAEDDFSGGSRFSLKGNVTMTRLNALGAEWRNDLQLGRTQSFLTEFYQPLDFSGHWFFAPGIEYTYALHDLYDGDQAVAEYRSRTILTGADIGYQIGSWGELRLGPRWGHSTANPKIGDPSLAVFDVRLAGISGQMVFDRTDQPGFPRDGSRAGLFAFLARTGMGSQARYDKVWGYWGEWFSKGPGTIFIKAEAGASLGTSLPIWDRFTLGGFSSFSGYHPEQLGGDYYGVIRAGYYARIGNMPPGLGKGVYFGGWLEAGNIWETRQQVSSGDLKHALTLLFGADTRLGPLYFAYGRAEGGNSLFYLYLGRTF